MKEYKLILVLILCVLTFIIGATIIGTLANTQEDFAADELVHKLEIYMPGNPVPGCSIIYYTYDFVSCTITGIPGVDMASLTVSEYSGQVVSLFVTLSEPIKIGDLVKRYGAYELSVKKRSWTWTWQGLVVYKYQAYGRPTKLTEVYMLSWRRV